MRKWTIFAGKNIVATAGSKLNDCINSEFLAASNAMVADESGVLR
jgi:hypothetical protein